MPRRKETRRFGSSKAIQTSWVSQIRWGESYTSLLLGIIAVVILALIIVSFAQTRRINTMLQPRQEVSSQKTVSEKVAQVKQPAAQKPEAKKAEPQKIAQNQAPKKVETKTSTNTNTKTYTMAQGDTLWSVSEKMYNDGFKWNEIAKANKISNPSSLAVGTKLQIPAIAEQKSEIAQKTTTETKAQSTPAVKQAPTTPTQTANLGEKITGDSYTVKHGDYLWEIAERKYGNGYRWVDIAKENNLANPSIIHSGNVLKLPR